MQNCDELEEKRITIVKEAISEILRSKIVPDLVDSTCLKLENSPATMVIAQKYEFHQSDIASLAGYLIGGQVTKAEKLVASHLDSGCAASALILSLFAPVAQLMGDKWCNDSASFAEVTLGMMELHSLLRSIDPELVQEFSTLERRGKALFSVMPGDTHIFGVSVLQSFFMANGWSVDVMLDPTTRSLGDRLASASYDIVGLSVASREAIPECKKLIKILREKTTNPDSAFMVGGLPFSLEPTLVSAVEADHMATDAFEALAIASSICEKKQSIESSTHYA